MILAVAATQMEMDALPVASAAGKEAFVRCLCGVGPVEAAVRISRFLARTPEKIQLVLLFGIAGAYCYEGARMPARMLELCLASSEVHGDLGVCHGDRIEYFNHQLVAEQQLFFDQHLLQQAAAVLAAGGKPCQQGPMVTVAACSGTSARGAFLGHRWQALAENMEGAAVARACQEWQLPLLELRAIANLVDDHDPARWRTAEACQVAGQAAALVLEEFSRHG